MLPGKVIHFTLSCENSIVFGGLHIYKAHIAVFFVFGGGATVRAPPFLVFLAEVHLDGLFARFVRD